MAVKTITIDMEAYDLLSKEKRGDESFSKVIKRTIKSNKKTAENLLKNLYSLTLSDESIENIEKLVMSRSESMISSSIIDSEK